MNPEDLPIDIHYNKLLDWLVSRRHCPQQWQGAALAIREKINDAIQDMPPVDEITQLLKGTYINYFHCQRICTLLKCTDDGSKNLFGRYSSKRMKDWLEIIKLYEHDNIYLAESAQMLMREVNYDVPALKKQKAKYHQTQKDCVRKEEDYIRNAGELREKYHISCRQFGIQGQQVKRELVDLVQDMPSTYNQITVSLKSLQSAIEYYSAFIGFMLNSQEKKDGCLSLIKHIITKGNTTTYEWKHGKVPSDIEEAARDYGIDMDEEKEGKEEDEIDWGDIGASGDTIDFDITLDTAGDQAADGVSAGDGIDWGSEAVIEVIDDSTRELPTPTGNGSDDSVARGSEALSLLDNPDTRNVIINELLELEAFLMQRMRELSDDSSTISTNQLNSAPRNVQLDRDTVQPMLADVSRLVAQVTSKKMRELFLIRSSPRYVDRVAENLKKILSDSEKQLSLSRLMVARQQETLEEEIEIQPKIDQHIKRTKELQKQIEQEISKKYKGRRVNIMGEINTM